MGSAQAEVLANQPVLRSLYDEAVAAGAVSADAASWVVQLAGRVGRRARQELPFGGGEVAAVLDMVGSNAISSTTAKRLMAEIAEHGGDPRALVAERGLGQMSDDDALGAVVAEVLAQQADAAARYRAGEHKLLGFLTGQVMRATRGRADAKRVNALLREQLALAAE